MLRNDNCKKIRTNNKRADLSELINEKQIRYDIQYHTRTTVFDFSYSCFLKSLSCLLHYALYLESFLYN